MPVLTGELGHSLWFVPPSGDTRKRLDKTILDLAKKYSSPLFVPHLTLAPDISFSQVSSDRIVDFTRSIASQIHPFTLEFKALDGVPGRANQCLYILFSLPSELKSAVDITRTALRRDLNNPPFKPHMSLMYKESLGDKDRSRTIESIKDSLSGLTIQITGIQIWTNGESVENWHQVGPELQLAS